MIIAILLKSQHSVNLKSISRGAVKVEGLRAVVYLPANVCDYRHGRRYVNYVPHLAPAPDLIQDNRPACSHQAPEIQSSPSLEAQADQEDKLCAIVPGDRRKGNHGPEDVHIVASVAAGDPIRGRREIREIYVPGHCDSVSDSRLGLEAGFVSETCESAAARNRNPWSSV